VEIEQKQEKRVRISTVSIPKEIVVGLSEISLLSIHFGHTILICLAWCPTSFVIGPEIVSANVNIMTMLKNYN